MKHLCLFLTIFPLLITSCQFGQEEAPLNDAPIVQIDSPASNARIPVGQEIEIKSTAKDKTFIQRVELYVNDDLIQKDAPPIPKGQMTFTVLQRWVPTEAGQVKLYVLAYDSQGKASYPAAIMLEVMADSPVAPAPAITFAATEFPSAISAATALPSAISAATALPSAISAATALPSAISAATALPITPPPTIETISLNNMPSAASIPVIEGRLITAIPINIFIAPGTQNSAIGVLKPNDVVIGVARNPAGDWIKIIYGPDNREGWIFMELFVWQGDLRALAVE